MAKVVYQIVEHDGGWAYRSDGVYSETFASHDAARAAGVHAALEERRAGDDAVISYEDENGAWHDEAVDGGDRPDTAVEG